MARQSDSHRPLKKKNLFLAHTLPQQLDSQHRLISPRLIEHSRNITNFLGTGRPH